MVLADLGRKLNSALSALNRAPVVDEKVLDSILKEIVAALLESDVNVKLVSALRQRVKTKVKATLESNASDKSKEVNRKHLIQKAVFDELVALVDPGVEPYKPKKGQSNIIMAVGLQGNGKTTTCTKLAVHYQKRGFKSAIVCADTFRAGAFDQTRQSATKAKVAYFGSYTETDPVSIAAQGVAKFKKERFDVIIVDTSGRHKQESELFQEMVQISEAVQPHMTVLILDASIGQAAEAQSQAFKEAADFGAIIVTKMDGHAKGGGAISAVAATKTPIIFLGVGEHLHDLDRFSPQPFISKLLGLGDVQGLVEHMQDLAASNPDKQKEMAKKLEEGKLSIRDWREQLSNVMNMGPISKIASMIPGLPQELLQGSDEEGSLRMKRMIYITDSMTASELDSDGSPFMEMDKDGKPIGLTWRVTRVARGSGTSVREVEELLCQYRVMANMAKQAGGKNGWLQTMQKMQAAVGKGRGAGGMPTPGQIQAMQRAMPPGMLQQMQRQMRSGGGMQDMLKAMMQSQGLGDVDMEEMQRMMGQMGGGLGGLGGLATFPMNDIRLQLVGDDDAEFFRTIHGRRLTALSPTYPLPVDDDEVKRSQRHHRLLQFVFSGRNYVGPVKEALQFGEQRRVLDLGTGSGIWAIDTADEFPRAEVIGVDLAPIQPRQVPPNCTFELCDVGQWNIPYPDSHFDLIHARSLHIGIEDYPRFLHEVARLLRPGGLVLLVEPTLYPCSPPPSHPPMRGWTALWETYRACLQHNRIDVTVPERLPELLQATAAFERITVKDGTIPVGFWPTDPYMLSIGQLQWMDYELLLPALKPLLLCSGIPPSTVDHLIKDAQHDLYSPTYSPSTLIHIAYASKCYQ